MVQLRAVRHSLDPAGGDLLKRKLQELTFSPSDQSLESATREWIEDMNLKHNWSWKLPSSVSCNIVEEMSRIDHHSQTSIKVATSLTSLPPETFTELSSSTNEEREVSQPVVIKKFFAAAGGGRTGVAVSGPITCPSPVSPSTSAVDQEDDLGPTAYLLEDGRCYDARGLDITNDVSASSHHWLVLDCSRADGISIVSSGGAMGTAREGSSEVQKAKATKKLASSLTSSNPSWPGITSSRPSAGSSDQPSDAALAAAMKELGLSSLPQGPSFQASVTLTPPPVVDMRLRPKSGAKELLARTGSSNTLAPLAARPPIAMAVKAGGGGREEGAMEQMEADEADFEARLSRNIEAGMSAQSRTSPARSGVSLAPISKRSLSSKNAASGGAMRSLARSSGEKSGYGEEEDVEMRLQRQIVAESSAPSRPSASSASTKKPPQPPTPSKPYIPVPAVKKPAAQTREEKEKQDAWDAL